MGYKIAVVGATGNVGREMLNILDERRFPADEVVALASSSSIGREVAFGDRNLKVQALEHYDFTGIDFVFSSAGAKISEGFAPRAGAQGAIVIDNTSHFRMDEAVPLVVPEVNAHVLKPYFAQNERKNIIANPNCSTIQMVLALKPLHELAGIERVVVATYQSVSGSGRAGMDELFNQTRAVYVNDPLVREKFTKEIAFNVIPHIDSFMEDGSTKEEWKMKVETQKILDPAIKLIATCVRVPVFVGHSEAITIECKRPISVEAAQKALKSTAGIVVVDLRADEGYVTPKECAGEDATYISRIRADDTVENGLAFWVVSDNLRKGAALNAVQIGESIIKQGLR
ncbi:MAG: aspartate-semialdehyde dehydrogenase [Alphaproteobacteria bacterium]